MRLFAVLVLVFSFACDRSDKDSGANLQREPRASKSASSQIKTPASREEPAAIAQPAAKSDDSKPAEHEPHVVALEDLADVMCSCTTPSCVHRLSSKVERWKKDREERKSTPSDSQKQRIRGSLERLSECADTAASDQ